MICRLLHAITNFRLYLTFKAIKDSGYDNWLTIEAFGRGLPELAAATRVWRDFAESPKAVYREGYSHTRDSWAGS